MVAERWRVGLACAAALVACGGGEAEAPPDARPVALDARGVVDWIARQRGKPVLVNFWATWCGPCLAELPDLLAATRTFRARGGVVVGVAMEQMALELSDEQAVAKATAKARELGVDFPTLVCTDDEMTVVRAALGVELGGLPQTLAYDASGRLVEQHEGIATRAQFAALAAQAAGR